MVNKADKNLARLRRHKRVRGKISGTADRPRMNVFRSRSNIYVQLIDDTLGKTLVSASSLDKEIEGYGGNNNPQHVRPYSSLIKFLAQSSVSKTVSSSGASVHT